MTELKHDETLEDLRFNGLRMIQKKEGFRFGEDSVLLANYVSSHYSVILNASLRVIDLGCNCGSISLLLAGKLPGSFITGVEIEKKSFEVFEKNIRLNKLETRMSPLLTDWKDLREICATQGYDCVVSNPPYKTANKSHSQTDYALEEQESTMEDLMSVTHDLLKPKGFCFFIYRAERLPDVIFEMRKNKLEPKKVRMIHPYAGKPAKTFIVTGQKNVKRGGFVVEPPLIVHQKAGGYTPELKSIYANYPGLSKEELYRGISYEKQGGQNHG